MSIPACVEYDASVPLEKLNQARFGSGAASLNSDCFVPRAVCARVRCISDTAQDVMLRPIRVCTDARKPKAQKMQNKRSQIHDTCSQKR